MKETIDLCDRCKEVNKKTIATGECLLCGKVFCNECGSSLELELVTLKGMHSPIELLRLPICLACLYKISDKEEIMKKLLPGLDIFQPERVASGIKHTLDSLCPQEPDYDPFASH